MKRLVLALAAIATVAGPLAVATEANAQPRRGYERQWDRREYDHRDYDRRDYGRRDYGRRDYGYRYAPPPRAYYGYAPPRYGYAPGYAWRRGAYLPPAYGGVYISNYGAYGLRAPPRGYRWHRVGDDYLLTAIATGLIFDIVTR